jgi:hypothetical protein
MPSRKGHASRLSDSFRPDGPRLYYDHPDGLEIFTQKGFWL